MGFFVKDGSIRIHSQDFKGMHVDSQQSMETLIGLNSKLLLRQDEGSDRLVLVPEGELVWDKSVQIDHHVFWTVPKSTDKYHAYRLDDLLHKLAGNGSLQSLLYLAYLHAMTAHCLPDPFTRRTGTEEALTLMRSAGVRSAMTLSEKNIWIVVLIHQLSPSRRPNHPERRTMQTVSWSRHLSSLAQHPDFVTTVQELLNRAKGLEKFYQGSFPIPKLDAVDEDLVDKAAIRSSTFYVTGFGAENYTTKLDSEYVSRGREQYSEGCKAVYALGKAVLGGEGNMPQLSLVPINQRLEEFVGTLAGKAESFGASDMPINSSLQYHPDWVRPVKDFTQESWCDMHQVLLQKQKDNCSLHRAFWMAAIAYASRTYSVALALLYALSSRPKVAQVPIPDVKFYINREGHEATESAIIDAIKPALWSLDESPEQHWAQRAGEDFTTFQARRKKEFTAAQNAVKKAFAEAIVEQWRCETPKTPEVHGLEAYVKVDEAMRIASDRFKVWNDNFRFHKYQDTLVKKLQSAKKQPEKEQLPEYDYEDVNHTLTDTRRSIHLEDLFVIASPGDLTQFEGQDDVLRNNIKSSGNSCTDKVRAISTELEIKANSEQEFKYTERLNESIQRLEDHISDLEPEVSGEKLLKLLKTNQVQARSRYTKIFEFIRARLEPTAWEEDGLFCRDKRIWVIMSRSGLWPRISERLLLEQMHRDKWSLIPGDWKMALVRFASYLSDLQWAERLLKIYSEGDMIALNQELLNQGPRSWNPMENPEPLLLEIESNIRIRTTQMDIAMTMFDPPDGVNTVLQLNMGEGKSSVIIPLVAMMLADRNRLVRVIVAKPQAKQMLDMLLSKLGGLIGRQVYQLPFSRSQQFTEGDLDFVEDICDEATAKGGVFLVQPEHVLSLQNMTVGASLPDYASLLADRKMNIHRIFNENSRDIIDETDEIFSPKFELIHTIGKQCPIDHAPDRWYIIQFVLGFLLKISEEVKKEYPKGIDIESSDMRGRYPRIRVLDPLAWQELAAAMCEHICTHNTLPGFPAGRHPKLRKSLLRYILCPEVSAMDIGAVKQSVFWTKPTQSTLLLLRGLFACGILNHALSEKRWRVHYGLDSQRKPPTQLAVPYAAKDCPTLRAEFSDPDLVIVLTCLSYYYGGLSDDDLKNSVTRLLKSDQAQDEYDSWVSSTSIPRAYLSLEGVHWEDEACRAIVFTHLRYSKGVIDFFLNNMVFPRQMREFPKKLSASGWDLGKVKSEVTTGFSGTNDLRTLLPLDMNQLDLPELQHTNALVLRNLLHEDNTICEMKKLGHHGSIKGTDIINMIVKSEQEIRVILDVGAQILDLTNEKVADLWLKNVSIDVAEAVVYCNEADELTVLSRGGHREPLKTSKYLAAMEKCLVFLDEVHTRGIDLRLPSNYRAVVTLGAGLTKDRLAQGERPCSHS